MKSDQKYTVQVLVSGIRFSRKEIVIPANLNLDDPDEIEDYIHDMIMDEDISDWDSTFSPDDCCEYPLEVKFSKL